MYAPTGGLALVPGARIAIVARGCVGRVQTARNRVTGIVRARIVVVAHCCGTGGTLAFHAGVLDGARIVVVTGFDYKCTTRCWVTTVDSTELSIVTR